MYKSGYLDQAARKIEQYLVKYGDAHWKANLHFMLWSVSRLFAARRSMRPKNDGVCRIACELKGGVGDIVIGLNYLRNFERYLDCEHELDLYCATKRGLLDNVRDMCHGQEFLRRIESASAMRRDYDLLFEIVRLPRLVSYNRGKIASLSPKLADVCDEWDRFARENPLFYRSGTPGDYLGTQYTLFTGRKRSTQADLGGYLGVEDLFVPTISGSIDGTLGQFDLADRSFVTLQRGVGGGNRNASTKLWPLEQYAELVRQLSNRYPNLVVVQLGSDRTDAIPGVGLDLRGKTTFDEMSILLARSLCHIDGECGMVHLRHFLKAGPSVVLFGPTDERFFGYDENANLRSDACPGGCEWLSGLYTQKCLRGFCANRCLTELSAETVFKKVVEVIGEKLL